MQPNLPRTLLLSACVVATLAACKRNDRDAASATAAPAGESESAALTLDESKLPPFSRFSADELDPSQSACTDFNAYVNSKWLVANEIPSDRSSWGAAEILAERALAVQHQLAEQAAADKKAAGVKKIVGDFWATGMDEAKINAQGIEPLKQHLTAIDALTDQESIAQYLRDSASKGEFPLFSFGPGPDFKQSDINIAYAGQGGLGLPDKTYYFDADKKEVRDAYAAHVAKILELGGAAPADAAGQAKQVMAFETRLAKASLSEEDLSRDVELYYHAVAPADADKLSPNFPWTKFFQSQGLAVPAMFSLSMPAFHQEVSKMLADVPAAQWKAFLRYSVLDGAAPYLSEPFVQENFAFHSKTLYGQKEMKPRWKRVLGAINGAADETMGQLYVQVAFPPESKKRMEALVANLGVALKGRLEKLAWMSDATRQKALAKQATFTAKIGYPDKWRDWSGLSTNRDSYLGNVLATQEFNYKWNLGKIGKPVDKSEWGMAPQVVNAGYNPQNNDITFPAAILQPPYFDPDAPDEVNYGAIGGVIGHEMIHGYDDQGSRFGPTGNFEQWWTQEDSDKFAAQTAKLAKQFDGYQVGPGMRVNGNLTLGENIADLGGLDVAYDAMRKATEGKPETKVGGLGRDQQFFVGYALSWRGKDTPESMKVQLASDPHAPGQFRAIGPLANLPQFAAAFSCKAGDPMVRKEADRVVIW